MRRLNEPDQWIGAGQLRPDAPTTAGDFRTLEGDIRQYAVKVIRVMAGALWALRNVDRFPLRLRTYARDIGDYLIARVDPRDLPSLDQSALEAAMGREVESWIRKARAEFPPSWLATIGTIPTHPVAQPASPAGVGAIGQSHSWRDHQAEFLRYAGEHSELAAVWRWTYLTATLATAVALAVAEGEEVEPPDILRRMYQSPDESVRPPAPTGQWRLEGGSPTAQDLFRVISGRAAGRLPNPSNAEPWRLWLDSMRAEGYARVMPALGKSGQVLGSYPQGFEDRHIEHVFNASADFCLVRSLAEQPPDAAATVSQAPPSSSDAAPSETIPGTQEGWRDTRKGDIKLLKKADGSLYESVDFPTAERYADISARRRQQLMTEDVLKVVGKGTNRRITVKSLIAYCPPTEDAK